MHEPGDGGWTAGSCVELYGGRAFQTSSACARSWGRGGLGERALGRRAHAETEAAERWRGAELAQRGGVASRLGVRAGAPAVPGSFPVSDMRCLTDFFSKFLNRSALCGE
jgi:hypothetical protein